MPLYEYVCLEDHRRDVFLHAARDLGAQTVVCDCGHTMGLSLSLGRGLTYFEEGRARTIYNLGHEPVVVTSHEQHKAAMRRAGVEWATPWRTNKTRGWI
jgi:hypothetical protein